MAILYCLELRTAFSDLETIFSEYEIRKGLFQNASDSFFPFFLLSFFFKLFQNASNSKMIILDSEMAVSISKVSASVSKRAVSPLFSYFRKVISIYLDQLVVSNQVVGQING